MFLPYAEIAADAGSEAISTNGEPAAPFRQATILVVEDEATLRHPVAKMLRKSGFAVFEAADGNAAIDCFREHGRGIHAILLDMTLPGPFGQEIVAETAKLKPEIRVILTSAYSHEMIADSMTAPQIRGFIRKPFRLADLVKIIQSSLSA